MSTVLLSFSLLIFHTSKLTDGFHYILALSYYFCSSFLSVLPQICHKLLNIVACAPVNTFFVNILLSKYTMSML